MLNGETVETTTTYNIGGPSNDRGSSVQVSRTWKRCEDLGAGVFGVVHREKSREGTLLQQRAVKVLRLAQLRRSKIDYQKEIFSGKSSTSGLPKYF